MRRVSNTWSPQRRRQIYVWLYSVAFCNILQELHIFDAHGPSALISFPSRHLNTKYTAEIFANRVSTIFGPLKFKAFGGQKPMIYKINPKHPYPILRKKNPSS